VTFKSGRGGYRGGKRPILHPDEKRQDIAITLPGWILKRLRQSKEPASRQIEAALLAYWRIDPPAGSIDAGKDDSTTVVEASKSDQSTTTDQIISAYRQLSTENGLQNVEISSIIERTGIDPDTAKAAILEASKIGRAVLAAGDWSLSSKDVRKGVIEVDGRKHLLVKFK
jgi:hypothetical protein